MKLLLANIDYRAHMTNEGDQFQEGLRQAGWHLSGAGYDGVRDVVTLLARYSPTAVVVHDKRDWDPQSKIAFRKDVGFARLDKLQSASCFKAVVVKDAATFREYQQAFYEEVGADAAIVYYHEDAVVRSSGWLTGKPLIRTYHSIDPVGLPEVGPRPDLALVSGARGPCYPLRERVFTHAIQLGVHVLKHPGYGNRGARTPGYLETLGRYRVHVATASEYGFALRKIIESVAMGCTPVTDLPASDVLPGIDAALVRVRPTIGVAELRDVINAARADWRLEERQHYATIARQEFDYRALGFRLDAAIEAACGARVAPAH